MDSGARFGPNTRHQNNQAVGQRFGHCLLREMPMAVATLGEVRRRSDVRHASWVRISHWILAASVVTLAVSGVVILMAHPRLYWGAVGNDLTPALIELPISRNYRHGGWEPSIAFFPNAESPVSAVRTYDILNENSWGRSLHFLAAWFLVVTAAVYVLAGIFTGHARRHLLPRAAEITPRLLWQDLVDHMRVT